MPIYEYICQDCGKKFDAIRSMKDSDAPISCKNCHGANTRRALSVFYASSEGRSVTHNDGGCGSCSGGTCSSCGHQN
ncbi:MAG TPA: zinc ribbon domain-containing protein [Longilinea sp.]|nr:zinc ribbon domain-containing protein [Longilinea sp.]